MALYREKYRLSNSFPGFLEIKEKLDLNTGLNNELEILNSRAAVFSNNRLKTRVEIMVDKDNNVELFYAPRKQKNYFEWALINVLNRYFDSPNKKVPKHVTKQWGELSFIERHFKAK